MIPPGSMLGAHQGLVATLEASDSVDTQTVHQYWICTHCVAFALAVKTPCMHHGST